MVWGTYLEKNCPSSNGHILFVLALIYCHNSDFTNFLKLVPECPARPQSVRLSAVVGWGVQSLFGQICPNVWRVNCAWHPIPSTRRPHNTIGMQAISPRSVYNTISSQIIFGSQFFTFLISVTSAGTPARDERVGSQFMVTMLNI